MFNEDQYRAIPRSNPIDELGPALPQALRRAIDRYLGWRPLWKDPVFEPLFRQCEGYGLAAAQARGTLATPLYHRRLKPGRNPVAFYLRVATEAQLRRLDERSS